MNKVIKYYNQFDEWGRLEREPIEFQVNLHYIKKYLPKSGNVLDNGAGPGKYAIELAKEGYHVTLTDITTSLVEIAKSKVKEMGLENHFNGFYVADARRLKMMKDESFDASFMLGPLYHLQEEKERIEAVKELNRVTKKNGIVFVAFMPRIRHVYNSLINPDNWRPNDNLETIIQFSKTGCFDHEEEHRFTGAYYFNIDDINPFMEELGFETIQLIGSNAGTILNESSWSYWKKKGQQEIEKIIGFIIDQATNPYILGISSHLLYIGKKK